MGDREGGGGCRTQAPPGVVAGACRGAALAPLLARQYHTAARSPPGSGTDPLPSRTQPMNLQRLVQESDTRAGRVFDLIIQGFILLSLISFSIETLPDLDPQTRAFLRAFEIVTVIVFTAEYLLRVAVSQERWRFVFSFYGMIDLLAILPFYIAPSIDLRSIRIVRLLRLFRILKLVRFSRAIARFRIVFLAIREELVVFLAASATLIYVAGVGIYHFENARQPETFSDVFSSMWWAVATLTTVGYGDVYPITVGGRVFTTVILFIGLGVIAVPAGLVASAMSEVLREEAITGDMEVPKTLPDRM